MNIFSSNYFNLASTYAGLFVLVSIALFTACTQKRPLFELLPAKETGIAFKNSIHESDTLNILNFEYIYNGGGVGIGDFNNDGLQDVFFTGNQVSCKLYINQGNFRFLDITEAAGINTPYWNTGVAIVDINQDGLPDIYISTIHPQGDRNSPNQLFLNTGLNSNGIPVFKEVADVIGLADRGYSTQAAFFDYDKDGDLDMYQLTNALETFQRTTPIGQRTDGSGRSTDRLYRNEGIQPNGLPIFKNVSKEAGITKEGWGLGVEIVDINNDGWPDVYCANDFQANDLIWVNNGDGTFTNRIADYTQHQSANSMGVDIADINNDGLPEIFTLDMMPEDNLRQKTMFSKPNYDFYHLALAKGYEPQFVRNALQHHNGFDAEGNPSFSEIAQLAGVQATDWSWSALFADFDHDGYKDLFITNGYRKDITNLDFIAYSTQPAFSFQPQNEEMKKHKLHQLNGLPEVKKSNFIFRNNGNLTFEDVTDKWGVKTPSFSNGAAYADLDNDGDLDIVVNNIDDEAFVYRNNLYATEEKAAGKSYLKINLKGSNQNREGFGTKIWVYSQGQQQYTEHTPYRGYKSSVDPLIHFGLGNTQQVDSIKINWLSGKYQTLEAVDVNRELVIKEKDATLEEPAPLKKVNPKLLFREVSYAYNLTYKHEERDFVDFKSLPALVQKHSQGGPALAVGDIDGDGLEDLFIGGSSGKSGSFFRQTSEGKFISENLEAIGKEKYAEDIGALLFDADQDGDLDVYCVSGSSEFKNNVHLYQDRLYRNNGNGAFSLDSTALPLIKSSGSCVIAYDFDKDNDLDLFIGGRIVPGAYPNVPQSYILRNMGNGKFEDVTNLLAPGLGKVGMVTAALWTDFNNDSWTDLVLVGEFMPVTFFMNEKGKKFTLHETASLQNSSGWWNSITAADFDNDGDLDYVAGNLGLNSTFKASVEEPVTLYAKDYNEDGMMDPIMTKFILGREYPVHYRETMTEQIVSMRKHLINYDTYGKLTFRDLFNDQMLAGATVLKSTCFSSAYIENKGNGEFSLSPLPLSAQFAPAYGLVATDQNADGELDILMVGNSYAPDVLTGRYDASIGTCLLGDGKGGFTPVSLQNSGFLVKGDAKGLVALRHQSNKMLYIISRNQDSLSVYENNLQAVQQLVSLTSYDAYAEITYTDNKKRKEEFYYGSGYLSQSSRFLRIPEKAKEIKIFKMNGSYRDVPIRLIDLPGVTQNNVFVK